MRPGDSLRKIADAKAVQADRQNHEDAPRGGLSLRGVWEHLGVAVPLAESHRGGCPFLFSRQFSFQPMKPPKKRSKAGPQVMVGHQMAGSSEENGVSLKQGEPDLVFRGARRVYQAGDVMVVARCFQVYQLIREPVNHRNNWDTCISI